MICDRCKDKVDNWFMWRKTTVGSVTVVNLCHRCVESFVHKLLSHPLYGDKILDELLKHRNKQ